MGTMEGAKLGNVNKENENKKDMVKDTKKLDIKNDVSKKESKRDADINKESTVENRKEEKIEVLSKKVENTAAKPETIVNEKSKSKDNLVEVTKEERKDTKEEAEID